MSPCFKTNHTLHLYIHMYSPYAHKCIHRYVAIYACTHGLENTLYLSFRFWLGSFNTAPWIILDNLNFFKLVYGLHTTLSHYYTQMLKWSLSALLLQVNFAANSKLQLIGISYPFSYSFSIRIPQSLFSRIVTVFASSCWRVA